jgi:hypothetical protein
MIKLSRELVGQLGLFGIPVNIADATLRCLYDVLEFRTGTVLSADMTDQQLREFEQLVDNNDDEGATQWLNTHRPNYQDIVRKEYVDLCRLVAKNAHWLRILIASPTD